MVAGESNPASDRSPLETTICLADFIFKTIRYEVEVCRSSLVFKRPKNPTAAGKVRTTRLSGGSFAVLAEKNGREK